MHILFILIVIIFIAVGAYYGHLQHQKRIAELTALAAEYGWRFDPGKIHSHDSDYSHFEIFSRGHSRYAYNTIYGQMEIEGDLWPVQLGDYHYKITSNNGKKSSTRTYTFSYAIVDLPYVSVPELTIRREGFFDKVAGFFGFDDIDFESAEFSDRFSVKSSDKKFAYAVIHPRMMEFLLDSDPPTLALGRGDCCISDGNGTTWSPEQFRSRVRWIHEFFEHWPAHVVDDLQQSARLTQPRMDTKRHK